jgi:hypothetical protein
LHLLPFIINLLKSIILFLAVPARQSYGNSLLLT